MAVEALDYNPLIKMDRLLTPEVRKEWEKAHILGLKDLKFAERFFILGDFKFWRVLSYIAGKFPLLRKPTDLLDRFLQIAPFLKGWRRRLLYELKKRKKNE